MNRYFGFFPLVLALPVVAACGSTVVYDGDDPNATEGRCGEVCDAYPSCGPDEVEVGWCDEATDPTCHSEYLCCTEIYCQAATEECWEPPYCAGGQQVDVCPADTSCYEVTGCGITILCTEEVFCDGFPSCDPGDTEVVQCPLDAQCYTASMCGSTITCVETALPQHGCPPTPPSGACDPSFTQLCDYPSSESCFESYACQQSPDGSASWTFVGGGCAGSGGGA